MIRLYYCFLCLTKVASLVGWWIRSVWPSPTLWLGRATFGYSNPIVCCIFNIPIVEFLIKVLRETLDYSFHITATLSNWLQLMLLRRFDTSYLCGSQSQESEFFLLFHQNLGGTVYRSETYVLHNCKFVQLFSQRLDKPFSPHFWEGFY